jgi:hypothetical protein
MKYAVIKTTAREGKSDLPLEISKHIIEFSQVRVEPVKPWAPIPVRLFRGESENGKITRPGLPFRYAWKTFAKKRDRMRADNPIAFIHG